MKNKRKGHNSKLIGFLLIISGIILILSNEISGITGFATSPDNLLMNPLMKNIGTYFLGIALMIVGAIVVYSDKSNKALEIMVSQKAIDRSQKDKTVRQNINKYLKEIDRISQNPLERPQEILGEFHVSPQGHKDIRVAWHFDRQNNILYIDDLLYHERGNIYVDQWNTKARQHKIERRDYESSGYEKYSGKIAA